MADEIRVHGVLRPARRSPRRTVAGYRVTATLTRHTPVAPGRKDTVEVDAAGTGVADAEGAFELAVGGSGEPAKTLDLVVSSPDGTELHHEELRVDALDSPVTIRVRALEQLVIDPADSATDGERLSLTGRVIDLAGGAVPSGLPVVLWAVPADAADAAPVPVTVTTTQATGYFSADWPSTTLVRAFGRVAGGEPVVVPLDGSNRLPRRVMLAVSLADLDREGVGGTPVAPEPADLVNNPAAFSQDLGGGCVDLTSPNRTVEEFIYSMVVRTSEPEVKGVTFGRRVLVPPAVLTPLLEASAVDMVLRRAAAPEVSAEDLDGVSLDVHGALQLLDHDDPPLLSDVKRAGWLSEIGWIKDLIGGAAHATPVRMPLDGDHPIDWDDTPTVYQAITLARGHVLQFREVWRADGYSLGDLLHSLPLAPGQRRRVAIVDWERRTTTAREESLEYEERLDAFAGRDRDISEVVGSTLTQTEDAHSSNTTWGVSAGIGAGFIGSGFGIFGGVAGSHGGSNSDAWQRSSRSFAGDSLQSLRDRVMQRSSSVRDQRSTVVQTASQGETMRAETETVANYNHCHAITIEYFEVLRHFLVTHEIADVRECVFVPLPIREFDRGKALRWQTPLTGRLRDRSLLPAFDATRRIADDWVGWDYPESRYSEEPPQVLEGELRVSFVLPRPRDGEDGAFQIDAWNRYRTWLGTDPFELWTRMIQEGVAELNAAGIARRDRQFREKVAPEIAERVVAAMRFWYVDDQGGQTEIPLDATLVSRYAEGAPLYVSLRPRGALPSVPREKIAQVRISLGSGTLGSLMSLTGLLPPDAQVIVHSGKMRYRTEHRSFVLFSEQRILNDLSALDAVYVPTPTSWAETRNPREEDRRLSERLLQHLNNDLEHYHQVIWAWLDPQRRFMLLDGILVPGLEGRSVASVVENRVIGIAGNSMIMPVAPGVRLDPRVDTESEGDLRDLYAADAPPAIRVSLPTRGVYAESVLGDCNGCEHIDDTRYWRWTDDGMLAPPEIAPVETASRATDEEALTATRLPGPLVSIQNAPDLPKPVGLADVFSVLARPDLFADVTGLEGTQKNAQAAFDQALSATSAMAEHAAGLAKQNLAATNGERLLDRIAEARKDGLLDPGVAQQMSKQVLETMTGTPGEKADKKADSPVADPQVEKAIDKAAQAGKAQIKVQTGDETVEVSFDGGKVGSGGAPVPVVIRAEQWLDQPVRMDGASGTDDAFVITSRTIDRAAPLHAALDALLDPGGTLSAADLAALKAPVVRAHPADATRFQLRRALRIVYPADPARPGRVAGKGRVPLAVIVHGQHAWWDGVGVVPNHDGYAYLQEALAKRGIASVSVDTNAANLAGSLVEMRAEMVLGAIDALRTMDGDAASPLHGRLDLDRVGLLGHSRGGDAVVRAAILNHPRKHAVIRAVVSLAPTDFTGALADHSKRSSLDEATAGFYLVVYGGLDGDVSGLGGARGFGGTGFRLYDRATAPKAMVYLPGCNHNRFNRVWAADEFGVRPADVGSLHTRTDHEALLSEYVTELFAWRLLGGPARSGLFDGTVANSLGHPVSLQWTHGSLTHLVDGFEGATSPTGARTTHEADITAMADVVGPNGPLATSTSHQTRVLAIHENLAGPAQTALEIALAAGNRDWSGFDRLELGLTSVFDTSSAAALAGGEPRPPITVVVVDAAGTAGTAAAASFTTPTVPGRPVFHAVRVRRPSAPPVERNVTLHRMATVSVPLASLGVSLSDVRRIAVQPPAGFAQRIVLDSLWLVKR